MMMAAKKKEKSLGEQIRDLRIAKGMSLDALGAKMKPPIGRSRLSQIERDYNDNLTVDLLRRFAEALDAKLTIKFD